MCFLHYCKIKKTNGMCLKCTFPLGERFICDKISSVRPTDLGFAPQFQPEF